MKYDAIMSGSWSHEVAENRFFEPSDAKEWRAEHHRAEVVGVRVAEVDPHRVATMLLLDLLDAVDHLGRTRRPNEIGSQRSPTRRTGCFKRSGIVVQVFEGRRLRADVSAAEDVVLVAADRHDLIAVDLDLDAAHRFAEVAGSVVGGGASIERIYPSLANERSARPRPS